MSDLRPIDKASLTTIERLAREVLWQCDHLRRNGIGDEMRFGFIHLHAHDLERQAARAFRRYERQQRWERETDEAA